MLLLYSWLNSRLFCKFRRS